MQPPAPDPAGPGRESVWSYPRPPRLEAVDDHVWVEVAGRRIADTTRALRVLETSHPPTYYVNPLDTDLELLERTGGTSFCEWKGRASYFDIVLDNHRIERAAWWYASPDPPFEELRYHLAFYPSVVECYLAGERVRAQEGGFYGGWVTSRVAGPFKGAPGSEGW